MNGDGLPDLILPDEFRFVSVALGQTTRSYSAPLALTPAVVTALSVGDVNGDGLPEILAGGDQTQNITSTIFLNQGNSSFATGATLDPSAFQLADLTGHAVSDLIGGVGTTLLIWPNNGTLSFSSSQVTVPNVSFAMVADMDNDGHPDIVSVWPDGQGPAQIFYGNSAYQFTPLTINPNFDPPFAIGDFRADGLLDIGTGTNTFLNTGNRTFDTVYDQNKQLPIGNGFQSVVADFNGDGYTDIAFLGPGYLGVAIYYNYGDGTFYLGAQLVAEQAISAITVGDFDGDGRPDIAAGLESSYAAAIFFNQGNGQFTRSFFASGADATAVIGADLNRNGKQDIVIGNFGTSLRPANVNVVFHR